MTGKEIVERARELSGYKYWYGGKGETASIELADMLKKQNPSVWTESYYEECIKDIDGKTKVGDCSFLVCHAYGIPMIGSSQIKDKYASFSKEPKDGMILWRKGHVAIYGGGKAIQLKSRVSDYVEIDISKDKYLYTLYSDKISYYGWEKIDGCWYYSDEKFNRVSGWRMIDSKWYYFDPYNKRMLTGWQKIGGEWYYMNPAGDMHKGWIEIDSEWYYLDINSGKMLTGFNSINGSLYYLRQDGSMKKGKLNLGEQVLRFHGEDGYLEEVVN